jgi:hypothetical protein
MTLGRRARGAGLLGVVLAALAPAMARAEPLGLGWDGEITDDAIVSGHEFTGDLVRVPVAFEYAGPPGSVITDLTLELAPIDDACDGRTWTQPLASGDGDPTATTPTTDPASPSPSSGVATATWQFRVDPGCNGTYDLLVSATADPGGPRTRDESEALVVDSIRVSLEAPAPTGVQAVADAERKVTVRWSAPPSWADAPPADARGYRVERIGEDGAPVTIGETAPGELTLVDDDLVAAPAGTYRYRVIALRNGATGRTIASDAGEGVLELGPVAPPTSAGPAPGVTTTGANRGVASGRTPGRSVTVTVPPTTEFDPGFQETLDYGDQEFGAQDAVPPADLGFFADEEPLTGAGVLVPFAVALCLAVWAGHLRHLSRRAAPPLS